MNVTLPNGYTIKGIPEGTSKDEVMQKAIAAGYATQEDFSTPEQSPDGVEPNLNASQPGTSQPEESGFLDNVSKAWDKRGEAYSKNMSEIGGDFSDNWYVPGASLLTGLEAARRTGGAVAGGINDVIGAGIGEIAGAVLPESVKDSFKETISSIAKSDTGKSVAEIYKSFKKNNPKLDQELRDAGNMAGLLGGGAVAKPALNVVGESSKLAAKEMTTLIPQSAKNRAISQQLLLNESKETLPAAVAKSIEGVEPKLIGGPQSKELATLELKPQTGIERLIKSDRVKVGTDKVAREAERQGFERGVIQSVKTGNRADKAIGKRMVGIAERTKDNAEYGLSHRPTDVVGDSLKMRFKVVKDKNTRAGKSIDKVVKSIENRPFDAPKIESSFLSGLNKMGIKVGRDADGVIEVNFKGSNIQGIPQLEKTVVDVIDRMADSPYPKVGQAHDLKKYLDEKINHDKLNSGLQGKTEKLLKDLRANINEEIKATNPRYGTVNKVYSESVKALDELQSLAGKENILGEGGASLLGQKLRGIMSNNASRTRLVAAYKEIERLAKKYGGKFDDSIEKQVLLADELDKVFKPAGRTSFQGQFGQALERGAEATATGGSSTLIRGAGKLINKAQGINEKNKFKAIKNLLKE